MLPDFQLLPIAPPLSKNAQHRRLGIPCHRLGLHRCGNEPFCWPRSGNRVRFAALYLPPVLDIALGWISSGKTVGGVTDSSAPESTKASTKRNPALGVSLAMAHTDLFSSSFIKYWTRGTRVYQHHSGAWLQLTFFLLPNLVDRPIVFLWSSLVACEAALAVPCQALPELQTCLSHPSEA